MAERKGLSKKIRFEVFKRDSFTCQYCGNAAPEVVLEVDHIKPVSKDGDNEIINLITACKACNAGKSNRELSDDTVIAKRKAQLDELQERREQIEMMVEWQGELHNLRDQELNSLVTYINSKLNGFSLNDSGIKDFKAPLRKFGLHEMLESVSISAEQYIVVDGDGNQKPDSLSKFIKYIPKIAASRKTVSEKPYMMDLFYINGILKKRLNTRIYGAVDLLERAYLQGVPIHTLKALACNCYNYSGWENDMKALIEDVEALINE